MKVATTTLLAALLMIVGIGCSEQTGSPINGGDPDLERHGPEPPYSPEATEPDVPQEPMGSDTEPSPLEVAPEGQSPSRLP